MALLDLAGDAAGRLLAPLVAGGTRLRNGRLFHQHGSTWAATVVPRVSDRSVARLGERLSGRAIVRFSRAFLPPGAPVDLLGCAIRFRSTRPLTAEPSVLDQDLLLATVARPWLFGFALAMTDPDDVLANLFYGTSPYALGELGAVRLRLVPLGRSPLQGDADERLELAVRDGLARLVLELTTGTGPWPRWLPVAEVRVQSRLALDPAALAFSPFRTGAGLEPKGFVQKLRKATYRAAQRTRRALQPAPPAAPEPERDRIVVPLRGGAERPGTRLER